MALRLAIIADDLTGALDAAAPFAEAGWRTVIATAPEHLAFPIEAEVLAVSTESREIPADAAVARVRHCAERLDGVPLLFKKIDSRLKGNVGPEIIALAQARGLGAVMLCPAVPELGRIARDGHVTGFGVPDPIPIAATARIEGLTCFIPDAGRAEDLDHVVATAGSALLAGARGLAAALARRMGRGGDFEPFRIGSPMAMAIGSRDPITIRQIERLAEVEDIRLLRAPNGAFDGPVDPAPVTVLWVTPSDTEASEHCVRETFAASFVPALSAGRATLVLSGGATAAAVLRRLGAGVLRLLGEFEPGVPVAVTLDTAWPTTIVTKSGGFGSEEILANLARRGRTETERT